MEGLPTRWIPWAAALLLALQGAPTRAAVLDTHLDARVGANYQPLDDDERAIWESLARLEDSIRTSPQRLVAPDLETYTREVIERLIGRPAPELRIYLVHDSTFNAAMFPSGMMLVNTGLLARVRSEAQFAAVIGHEAGHYLRKHAVDRYRALRQKAAIMRVTSAAGRGNGYGWAPGPESWDVVTQATARSVYKFSRAQESEADAYGVMLMARAGYPPAAASAICAQLLAERRASAAARGKRYIDGASSALSTHPATGRRAIDLADTAGDLVQKGLLSKVQYPDRWQAVVRPYQAMLLREQVYLNDPGASLYLLESLAREGWTALLRFNEGEVYRLRHAQGDESRAAAAYAAAVALPDAPPEAWRARAYALLNAGNLADARQAFDRYLALNPGAADAAIIRGPPMILGVNGGRLAVAPGDPWKKLPSHANESHWERVWTRNGPQLDRLALLDGLPEGKAIIRQTTDQDQQAPTFRADMTLQDLISMVEVAYRVKGVALFRVESIEPIEFLGGTGIQLRYEYASGIGITKRGRYVLRVVDRRLYAMKLDGVATPEFETVLTEFARLVGEARLRIVTPASAHQS